MLQESVAGGGGATNKDSDPRHDLCAAQRAPAVPDRAQVPHVLGQAVHT